MFYIPFRVNNQSEFSSDMDYLRAFDSSSEDHRLRVRDWSLQNKRLDPVLCSIRKYLIDNRELRLHVKTSTTNPRVRQNFKRIAMKCRIHGGVERKKIWEKQRLNERLLKIKAEKFVIEF